MFWIYRVTDGSTKVWEPFYEPSGLVLPEDLFRSAGGDATPAIAGVDFFLAGLEGKLEVVVEVDTAGSVGACCKGRHLPPRRARNLLGESWTWRPDVVGAVAKRGVAR
jgi:hypothetical protein